MKIIEEIGQVKAEVQIARSKGRRIALVPTMGALHAGHVELIREARRRSDTVILSIFVNPTQFAPGEDFDSYPRTLETDIKACRAEGVDIIFTPIATELYPAGFSTIIDVGEIGRRLCGASRPGHFSGVATIVLKLLNITEPDLAIFGKKDFQQLSIIEQMVRDLNKGVEVVGVETVRELDGLAMSSRNSYLNEAERSCASALPRALGAASELFNSGVRDSSSVVAAARKVLDAESLIDVEYIKICEVRSLEELETIDKKAVLALAVKLPGARLIDNVELY